MDTERRMRLLERRASRQAWVYAEAQAMVDGGASVDEALAVFDREADWLGPLLEIGHVGGTALGEARPDPEFKETLREAFLTSARRPSFVPMAETSLGWLRTSFAAAAVATFVVGLGIITYGFVTADDSSPGDWNYTLKVTRGRIGDVFENGDGQVDVQIRQTEARVFEVQQAFERGSLLAVDLENLERDARDLAVLARDRGVDDSQRELLRVLFEEANAVLSQASEQQPELAPAVISTQKTVDDAVVATGVGPITPIIDPAAADKNASGDQGSEASTEGSTPPEDEEEGQ